MIQICRNNTLRSSGITSQLEKARESENIRKKILKYGEEKLKKFEEFVNLFGIDYIYR